MAITSEAGDVPSLPFLASTRKATAATYDQEACPPRKGCQALPRSEDEWSRESDYRIK